MSTPETPLERVQAITLVDPTDADRINNPETVKALIGVPLQFSASIESEVSVSGAVAEAMLPNMDTELTTFFDNWYPQEGSHGDGQRRLLDSLGLEPIPEAAAKVSAHHKYLGMIASRSERAHDTLEALVMGYMAIGEKETVEAYTEYARRLARNGEPELARMFGRYASHERLHLDYQKTRAHTTYKQLGSLAFIPGRAITISYTPVGVTDTESERGGYFAYLLENLADDDGVELASELSALVSEMFPNIPPDHPFALKTYQKILQQHPDNDLLEYAMEQ